MKKFTNILLAVLLSATAVTAQTTSTNIEKPFIEVTGTAEKEVVPDEIYIAITIREREENRTKITVEQQETALKEALKSIGVPLENLSLSDANANYVQVAWFRKDVIAKKQYLLKVSDAITVGKVFEKLDELKINDARISRVDHSKIDSLKKEVRIMAIVAAKEKADYLLQAIGEERGKPLLVTEHYNTIRNLPNRNVNTIAATAGGTYSKAGSIPDLEESIQFEKVKIEATIYVKFGIK